MPDKRYIRECGWLIIFREDGEARFELLFNPCRSNLGSLCPARPWKPISAAHEIPLSEEDVAGIPGEGQIQLVTRILILGSILGCWLTIRPVSNTQDIAFSIPDFEGRAVFRVFSNTTRTQVGCISATVTNGKTFSHPEAVISITATTAVVVGAVSLGSILLELDKFFTRDDALTVPLRYPSTLSAYLVASTLQTIYFSGALSLNFPSNLIAWWSNFAWSVGIIYNKSMQEMIDAVTGDNVEPTELGYNREAVDMINKIYYAPGRVAKRDPGYGSNVKPGIPTPGTYVGFRATLAATDISAQNAFITSIVFLLAFQCAVIVGIPLCRVGFRLCLGGDHRWNRALGKVIRNRPAWTHLWFSIWLRTVSIHLFGCTKGEACMM